MVFGLEQLFRLFDVGIELDPLLVNGLGNAASFDPSILQPLPDSVDGLLCGSKDLDDFLRSIVLAESG